MFRPLTSAERAQHGAQIGALEVEADRVAGVLPRLVLPRVCGGCAGGAGGSGAAGCGRRLARRGGWRGRGGATGAVAALVSRAAGSRRQRRSRGSVRRSRVRAAAAGADTGAPRGADCVGGALHRPAARRAGVLFGVIAATFAIACESVERRFRLDRSGRRRLEVDGGICFGAPAPASSAPG